MFKPRKRRIALGIAVALAIAAGVAASEIAGPTTEGIAPEASRRSEIQQPVAEALLPPVTPEGGSYRM